MKRAAFVYPLIGLASVMAIPKEEECCRVPPAPCYPDKPICTFCVGPDLVNPSVRPKTCDGDLVITAGALIWSSHQDGMEYAIETAAGGALTQLVTETNNLIDATYKNPNFKWNLGFEIGIGYNTDHDGWDLDLHWTHYRGSASSHDEAENDDNFALVALWSAFNNRFALANLATDIETHWRLQLNLLDATLGREFWTSKYLSLRPFVGLRISWIDQHYTINHKGGTWNAGLPQPQFNNEVNLTNNFRGVGPRAGLDSTWHFGKGFSLYNHMAAAIIYGRFKVKHDEWNRLALAPHGKCRVLETEDHFRAGRMITDLSLGIQWSTLFNDCRNTLSFLLAWDHHMFFDQNQMWRVKRIGGIGLTPQPLQGVGSTFNNDSGENVFYQRRGDLDTQGLTIRATVTF